MTRISQFASGAFVDVYRSGKKPQISILMPLYSQFRFVSESIESVLGQRNIVAEIIISDDASDDDTFNIAFETVINFLNNHGTIHHVVMRKGGERLWRDHLPLMIDNSSCDLVCQAHGDDLFHPGRARLFVQLFRSHPEITMACSPFELFEEGRQPSEAWEVLQDVRITRYKIEEVISESPYLIGASQAWRRSSVAGFSRLDREFNAVSHDRILPLRAALRGAVCLVSSKLLKRRKHYLQASKMMFFEPETKNKFGWALTRMSAAIAMHYDLTVALENKYINKREFNKYKDLVLVKLLNSCVRMNEVLKVQTKADRQIAWLDYDNIRELKAKKAIAKSEDVIRLHVFIISWTEKHENSAAIAREIVNHVSSLTVVYSDRDDSIVPDFPCQALRTPDNWYWGKKFKTCLDACGSDYMLVIHGDTNCSDWPGLLVSCMDGFCKSEKIGIWAPLIDFTPFDLRKTFMQRISGSSLHIVAQTDMIVVGLAKPVVSRLKELDYEDNKYGWGIGWAALAYSYANKLLAVVDEKVRVFHPRERGYGDKDAKKKMDIFLQQLNTEEQVQYLLLNSHINMRKMKILN